MLPNIANQTVQYGKYLKEKKIECANKWWNLPLAQKREGKNQNNVLEEGASKKTHAREVDTGISAPNIRWNSHKVNGDMPSSGSLPRIKGMSRKRKKEIQIFHTNPSTTYKLC